MVNLDSPEEWQRQSALLLQARPTTTRVTTKYKIPNLESLKHQKAQTKKRKRDEDTDAKEKTGPKVPRAALTLKTFDPESGVVLKFRTDRAADVGRLVAGLGRLGGFMAALPEQAQDAVMEEAAPVTNAKEAGLTPEKAPSAPASDTKPPSQQASTAGAGKKKKKGKK